MKAQQKSPAAAARPEEGTAAERASPAVNRGLLHRYNNRGRRLDCTAGSRNGDGVIPCCCSGVARTRWRRRQRGGTPATPNRGRGDSDQDDQSQHGLPLAPADR